MDFEAAWCPVCDKLIEPKRTTVPVNPPQPPAPAPPPTSPQSSPSKKEKNSRKPAARTRGGLVQGTGRMNRNGTIKSTSPKPHQAPQNPAKPIKYRTIIDQGPLPLYCSEECRREDESSSSSGSVSTESSRSSSIPSESSISTASSAAYEQGSIPQIAERPRYNSPTVALLAKIYNFPPAPPPAPISYDEPEPCRVPLADNGLIMAGRYLRELCSEPAKPQTSRHRAPVEPPKTIPGWNDGSHAWRSQLYNLSTPAVSTPQPKKKIVRSHLGDASIPLRSSSSASLPDDNTVMLNKYAESLGRRSGTVSPSSGATVVRRERSLLPPGVEGKLLVPDVKLKVRTCSSSSVVPRSPVSSESGDDDTASTRSKSPMSPRRPVPETRSWSYDNLRTYDLMPMPSTYKKEKRTQISIVDGKEVRVEYEVEVQQPLKRLFLFPAPAQASS